MIHEPNTTEINFYMISVLELNEDILPIVVKKTERILLIKSQVNSLVLDVSPNTEHWTLPGFESARILERLAVSKRTLTLKFL